MRVNGSSVSRIEVLQGGRDMEGSLSSKCATVVRRDDDRHSVRDGIRVDGERYHQRFCEGGQQRRSIETCMPSLHSRLSSSLVADNPVITIYSWEMSPRG